MPLPTLNIKPPSAAGQLLYEEQPTFDADSIRMAIIARVNYFVGKDEGALEKCLAQGLIYGKAQWWANALDEMIDALAYVDAASRAGSGCTVIDCDTHACILHNLATCCHHLGYFEAADSYYEQARTGMAVAPPAHPLFQCMPFLDPRPKQLEFMQHRADECKKRQMPDAREYFAGDGGTRLWTPGEIAAAVVQAKELEGEEKKSPALKLVSQPKVYAVGSTPRQQLW